MSEVNEKTPLLEVRNLRKLFAGKSSFFQKDKSWIKAVDDVSFTLNPKETLGVVGESGCGKSTMGRSVLRLIEPTSGEIFYKGKDFTKASGQELRKMRADMQIIFQDPYASLNPRMTIGEIIAEPLNIQKRYKTQEETRAQVLKVMEVVGLNTKYYNRYPHEFSGGQRQRIGLARAMVMDPELVVADEPISALDVSIRAQVLNLLKKFQRERGTTYLFIAHDLSIVRFISDRIGVIYKGDIVEVATAEELFDFPMHPYTRSLISAIPIPDPNLEKHKVLFSYDPSQHDYSEDKPELTDIGHGHFVFGNKKEIEEYKRLREEGTPIKSVTIAGVNAPADAKTAEKQLEEKKIEGSILDTPLHDTGSFWLAFLSFFLAIPGLIAGAIFKKHNYIRNYKKCKKGAIAGLITTAAIIVLFGLMLIISIL